MQGKRQEAEKVVAKLQKLAANQYVPPFEFALVYNSLGNRDQTFFWLNKAYEDRSETLGFIRNLPDFDAIRDDSRYSELLRKTGLVQ